MTGRTSLYSWGIGQMINNVSIWQREEKQQELTKSDEKVDISDEWNVILIVKMLYY